jgi:hypothetical protein
VVAWAVELANANDRGTVQHVSFELKLQAISLIAGDQFPVEKDFKTLVELSEVGTAG